MASVTQKGRTMRSSARIYHCRIIVAAFFCLSAYLVGCSHVAPPIQQSGPPEVLVSHPVKRMVTDYADYPSRTQAKDKVDIRARVWGPIDRVAFKEGEIVKEGDLLYEIDPRTYKAALDQSKARVALDKAQLKYNEVDFKRNLNLRPTGSVSQDDVDKARAARDTAAAQVGADEADVASKQLDFDFTTVKAPITGRISKTQVTKGNIVTSGQTGGTLLTTIVSVDPIYVYFDVDERTVVYYRKLLHEGKADAASKDSIPVWMQIEGEQGFLHEGKINFVDNQIDPKTGTLQVRGVFPNKDGILSPGMFCRVRVRIGRPHEAILITDRAIDTDQGQKIVYVLNSANEVQRRAVTVGVPQEGLLVIDEGLTTEDRVIVDGLQRIRPGMKVEPKLVDMPVTQPAK